MSCFLLDDVSALGGQRGEEEDEQEQRKSPQHIAPEDPQVQPGLRDRNHCLQGGDEMTHDATHSSLNDELPLTFVL